MPAHAGRRARRPAPLRVVDTERVSTSEHICRRGPDDPGVVNQGLSSSRRLQPTGPSVTNPLPGAQRPMLDGIGPTSNHRCSVIAACRARQAPAGHPRRPAWLRVGRAVQRYCLRQALLGLSTDRNTGAAGRPSPPSGAEAGIADRRMNADEWSACGARARPDRRICGHSALVGQVAGAGKGTSTPMGDRRRDLWTNKTVSAWRFSRPGHPRRADPLS